MRKLCIKLPPFAPDYSGVCSALYEMEGMSVIHDASGCTGNYTGYDEPRWYDNQSLIFCSGLREIDAVLGDDRKFINRIKKASHDIQPKFISIMGSPVPMVIGSDLEGIAKEIECEIGIKAMGFNTTGLDYYDVGIKKAYMQVAKRFLHSSEEIIPKSINILGATPLDFSINNNIKDIKEFFIKNGYIINSCWSMGCNLNEIVNTTNGEINVVISISGLELAKYLKKKFNMPYIVGLPIGKVGESNILRLLSGLEVYERDNSFSEEESILIIGEQVLSNSIRDVLKSEYEKTNIDVATFFMMDKDIATKNDFHIDNELHLVKILKENKYKTIIGDPLIKELIPNNGLVNYIDMPHVAISSKIYWDETKEVIGNKVYSLFK